MSIKDVFEEHKWLWAAVALLIFAAGAMTASWLSQEYADVDVTVMEAVKTEEASRKISETIAEAQKEREKLTEVVKNAKDNVVRDVADDTDDLIADRWNGILGQYRENRTQTEGL